MIEWIIPISVLSMVIALKSTGEKPVMYEKKT